MRFEPPLPVELVDELFAFWTAIFGADSDLPPEVLLGEEDEHNRTTVHLDRRGEKLAGTCVLMVSKRVPVLGGISAVATSPESGAPGSRPTYPGRQSMNSARVADRRCSWVEETPTPTGSTIGWDGASWPERTLWPTSPAATR